VIASFASTERQTSVAQRQAQATAVGQEELERLRDMPYGQLSLTGLPTSPPPADDGLDPGDHSPNNPRNPNFYINGSAFRIKQDFRDMTSAPLPGTPVAGEPLVTGGSLPPSSTFSVGNTPGGGTTGTIHRYVTWRDETCGPSLPGQLNSLVGDDLVRMATGLVNQVTGLLGPKLNLFCGDTQDAKRVILAVVLDRPGNRAGPDRPIWLSTVVYDPDKGLITY
jgi:hypothetical protein